MAIRLRGHEPGSRGTLTDSVGNCSFEKREAGKWGTKEFWKSEEGKRQQLKAATRQRILNTEKTLYVL
jgi:hypothetical protein